MNIVAYRRLQKLVRSIFPLGNTVFFVDFVANNSMVNASVSVAHLDHSLQATALSESLHASLGHMSHDLLYSSADLVVFISQRK